MINGEFGRYFQYDEREARVRVLTRVAWNPPWDIMIATTYRYAAPGAHPGSRLADEVARGTIRGFGNMSLLVLGAGLVYDTRDNEYFPHHGGYHQLGIRGVQGLPLDEGVRYAAVGAVLATYVPLGRGLVLAARGVVDAEVGQVPFFDLHAGGPFRTDEMIGGSGAIRGIPTGRYSGPLKAIGNVELRRLLVDFRVLGAQFHVGADLLFDTGRLWADYTFRAKADGSGLGLKWGAGGGGYLVWGQAAVFRVDVAYSPDAASANPNLPLGIYVVDGVMF